MSFAKAKAASRVSTWMRGSRSARFLLRFSHWENQGSLALWDCAVSGISPKSATS